MTLSIMGLIVTLSINDNQHNDNQPNDNQHNDNQHNDNQHNDNQHNNIQHNDTKHNGVIIVTHTAKMTISITTLSICI
jgi:hypothetical protein